MQKKNRDVLPSREVNEARIVLFELCKNNKYSATFEMKIIQIHVKMTQHTIKTSRMHFKKIARGAKHMRRVDEVFVQQSNTIFKRVHISVEN